MAYRRRMVTRSGTFKEDVDQNINSPSSPLVENDDDNLQSNEPKKILNPNLNPKSTFGNENGSLGARATRASAAHRDSSGYAYAYAGDPTCDVDRLQSLSFSKGSNLSNTTSMNDSNDSKYGFWGILASKAKLILEDDNQIHSSTYKMKSQLNQSTSSNQSRQPSESGSRIDNARLRKRLDAITSSLNQFGDTLGNAFEEGRTMMEHKTADIIQETRNKTADFIQETRKLQLRRRGGNSDTPDQATVVHNTSWQRPVAQPVQTNGLTNQETQLKASRDVAMATAAKAKVLLRELKTVKADLAFAKERCAQLEEENKRLREGREKGGNPADDDLIRLQLETLLAEKARLAHENSIYARENRFLKEIVEYHQLTMQDVVYLDEGNEEVTPVYPFSIDDAKMFSSSPTSPMLPNFLPNVFNRSLPHEVMEHTSETPMIYPTNPLERTKSFEVPTSAHLMVDDEEIKATPSVP